MSNSLQNGVRANLWEVYANDNSEMFDGHEALLHSSVKRFPSSQSVANKVAFVFNLALFGVTAYFGVAEALGNRNIANLSLCSFFNGASLSAFAHLLLSSERRKKVSAFISGWSYETIFLLSQVYLNLPAGDEALLTLPFIEGLGMLLGKDILNLAFLDQSDYPLTTHVPKEKELLKTIGFTTRSRCGAIATHTVFLSSAIGLALLNFLYFKENYPVGEINKIGLIPNLIAIYLGGAAGTLIARLADDSKERLENSQALLAKNEPSRSLQLLRIYKNVFVPYTPLVIGALLAIPPPPNPGADFAIKSVAGAFLGAHTFVTRRDFENPRSYIHRRQHSEQLVNSPSQTTMHKVKGVAQKYLPSVAFFGIITAFTAYAIANDTLWADGALLVFLLGTYTSFVATDRLAAHYKPEQNNRIQNELAYRFLHSPLVLSFWVQYFTSIMDIGDESINGDSIPLKVLSLLSWLALGVIVGSNRALYIQPKTKKSLVNTPPIALQLLTQTFVSNILT